MNNLHIKMSTFTNESRVVKQVTSLSSANIFHNIYVSAFYESGLEVEERFSNNVFLRRFKVNSFGFFPKIINRPIKYFAYLISLYFYYRSKNIKVINAHAIHHLPVALILAFIFKAKVIYDAHELETERNGLKLFTKKLYKRFEKWAINKADMTLVVSESIADWYANEYNIARPPVVLNAPNTRELKINNHFREQLSIREDQIILLYQGGLMPGRGVHLILEAFKQRKDDKVVAVFMGYGPLEADIKIAAEQHSNIYFFPAVPPQVVLEYTASADFGISLIENTCLSYYYCMPNKLFEYAMAGLPVLVSNMKDMSELVTRYAMGAVISDFSAEDINQAVDNFLEQDLTSMKANAYQAACENAWEVQEQKMLAAYQQLLNKV